ncbi:hypothetical protein CGL51_05260 [Pyrobaculum aerophilum]|uniref:Uncharacterized protein n=1 Tax=Pyrobaculum aerophilum TaxID=13773 RepID=A0A371R032_9CREN|nr:hypothetical protein CGL51_05260 [Pyrobaculum aerophilum]
MLTKEPLPPSPPRAGWGGPSERAEGGGSPFGAKPAEGKASFPGGFSAGGVNAEHSPRGAREVERGPRQSPF